MVRVSNTVLAIFNCVTLVIGLTAMGFGLHSLAVGSQAAACQRGIQTPLMVTGAALSAISILGLIGSCCRVNFVLILYLTVMFMLILGLIGFTIFTVLITNEAAGNLFSMIKIANFKYWLRNHFVNDKNWNDVKNCFIEAKICNSVGDRDLNKNFLDFYQRNLSPMQSGCCKPPASCGFVFQNATSSWVPPKSGATAKDGDCSSWSNQQKTLCYNCESCKAGFVDSIRNKWRHLAIFNVCVTLVAITVYSIGCCAKRNNGKDGGIPF